MEVGVEAKHNVNTEIKKNYIPNLVVAETSTRRKYNVEVDVEAKHNANAVNTNAINLADGSVKNSGATQG